MPNLQIFIDRCTSRRDNFDQDMVHAFQTDYLELLETIKALPPIVESQEFRLN